MNVRHFIKILAVFTAMIILGMLGVYIVNHYGEGTATTTSASNQVKVAK